MRIIAYGPTYATRHKKYSMDEAMARILHDLWLQNLPGRYWPAWAEGLKCGRIQEEL